MSRCDLCGRATVAPMSTATGNQYCRRKRCQAAKDDDIQMHFEAMMDFKPLVRAIRNRQAAERLARSA